jgi:threonine dehydratase
MPTTPDVTLLDSVTIDHVRAAAARLDGVAIRTPVHTSRQLDELAGASVFLKCESFQRVGAFKIRGAYNALSRLTGEQKSRGVLTYSSGNHAQAVALASRLLGITATIVMPRDAPKVKLAATMGYLGYSETPPPSISQTRLTPPPGAGEDAEASISQTRLTPSPPGRGRMQGGQFGRVVQYDKTRFNREAFGAEIAEREGLTIVPPYDHPDIIAGQGTAAIELFEEVGDLDALYIPCGGGGLLSGCATVAKSVCQGCRVIGVEPAAGDDAARSFASGELQTVDNPDTIADGARTPSLGRYTFAIVMARVDDVMTVTDEEIVSAMRFVWERMKLVVEPTGALGVAGLLKARRLEPASTRAQAAGPRERIGVVISGGNVDVGAVGTVFGAS